jgi:hypothetical protein
VHVEASFKPLSTFLILTDEIFLTYQSSSQARQAKTAIDQAIIVAKAKGNPIDPSVLVTYLKEAGAKSLFPPAFSVWVGNLKDSDDSEIEKKLSKYGPLVTFASHGLPPFKIFETIPGNKSAIFNFINFKDAKTALDACTLRLLIFGKSDRAYATGQPQTHTKLVLDVLERCRSQNHLALSFMEVDLVASQQGNHKPERWIDALRLCPNIFDIDDRHSIISIRGGPSALESLLPASLPSSSAQGAWAAAAAGSTLGGGGNVWGSEGLPDMNGFGDVDGSGVAASVAHLVLGYPTDAGNDSAGGPSNGDGGSNGGMSGGLQPGQSAVSRPRLPPAGRPQDWSVQEVCDLLEGTCGYNAAGVRTNSVDGKTLIDLFSGRLPRVLRHQ